MYVCICNAIRESDLRRAAACTSGTVEQAYAALGKSPNCGQCLVDAAKILEEVRESAPAARSCKELAI
ncbi:MAG: (2Fe-2S)-binding protein [Erythrobacter sp.]